MDIDFHYYITFILCQKAGFSSEEAYKIAYSSQYTDDNNYHYYINMENGGWYINQISQTLDITKPSEKRKTIYPLFHFIPGGEETRDACRFDCGGIDCFVTVANSQNAQDLVDAALDSKDLYRIGIALHAYADTWSHQNFIGYKHKLNAQKIGFLIPNIGHADFFHEPDRIHNTWVDGRLPKSACEISNDDRFLSAAREIFIRLYKFKHQGSNDQQAVAVCEKMKLDAQLRDAMDERYLWGGSPKARQKAYKKICPDLKLKKFAYDPKAWRYAAVQKRELEADIFDRYWARDGFENSDWLNFQKAVEAHKTLALEMFEPLFKQAGFSVYG